MQEDFLHYIWKHKKFDASSLETTEKETISLVSVGQHNLNSGPDFFNAQLKIDNQLWAGNVEIHVKSSDWFLHNHETDAHYDTVILHVVWEHDSEVFRKDNTAIPVLELKEIVSKQAMEHYKKLFSKGQKWINCEADFADVADFKIKNWLERLYFERLERKSNAIDLLLKNSKNDWEAVLFKMLAKNFGLKVNGEAFLSMANAIDFSVVRKIQSNRTALEALFFGQSHLLEKPVEHGYFQELSNTYSFLSTKFKLSNKDVVPVQFFRLRPPNFPTIRLAHLASFYNEYQNSFSKIMETNTIEAFYEMFALSTSSFWESHYTFSKASKPSKKILTHAFVDLLLINTIIPLKFSYAKYQGKEIDDTIIQLIQQVPSEKNSIIEKFNSLKKVSENALQSQGLLQLKNNYCDYNKCLQCVIGSSLLHK
ncbi:DUF2851 family protein [Mariniflexile ostreae]|uniref:DUF2851 family protein n=1 Tax=Mariniflexile ostreae TaxID=1520892 RepID=A0ABV5F793_9FLAO